MTPDPNSTPQKCMACNLVVCAPTLIRVTQRIHSHCFCHGIAYRAALKDDNFKDYCGQGLTDLGEHMSHMMQPALLVAFTSHGIVQSRRPSREDRWDTLPLFATQP